MKTYRNHNPNGKPHRITFVKTRKEPFNHEKAISQSSFINAFQNNPVNLIHLASL